MLQRKRALTGFPNLAQARPDLSTRLGPLPPLYPVGATRRLRIVPLGMVQPPPFFDLMMFGKKTRPESTCRLGLASVIHMCLAQWNGKRPGQSRRVDCAWRVIHFCLAQWNGKRPGQSRRVDWAWQV